MPFAGEQVNGVVRVASTYENVRLLANRLRGYCRVHEIAAAIMADLEIALVEAANNVIRHGYAGRSDGFLEMKLDSDGMTVTITLRDGSAAISQAHFTQNCELPPSDAESGRGIAIILGCVDSLEYETHGGVNILRMAKKLRDR